MKRWHEDYKISLRECKKRKAILLKGLSSDIVGYDRHKQVGRFRKKDAFDCGNARCGCCHCDKFPKREKHEQEILSELSFHEQLMENEIE